MKHRGISWAIVAASFIAGGVIVAFAQTDIPIEPLGAPPENPEAAIIFPIAELGNCTDKENCKTYCDAPDRAPACIAFAESHGLMKMEEAKRARTALQAIAEGGPGGCTDKASCENYCDDVSHIDECIAFGEKHGFVDESKREEAKKVAALLKSGVDLPGGCRNKSQCESYCSDPANGEECIAFAERAGFIPPEEAAQARKVLPLMARGEMPGRCKSKDECRAYCESGDHRDECVAFAERAGFMTHEEAEMARKTGGKGPNGCTSKQECEAFCNNPTHQEMCFAFAKEHSLIKPEELKNIEDGAGRMREGLSQMPPEIAQCLKESVGEEVLQKLESGTLAPGPELGKKMQSCFESFHKEGQDMMPSREGEGGFPMSPAGTEGQFMPEEMMADKLRRGGIGNQRMLRPEGNVFPPHSPAGGESGPQGEENRRRFEDFRREHPDFIPQEGGMMPQMDMAQKCAGWGGTWSDGYCSGTSPASPSTSFPIRDGSQGGLAPAGTMLPPESAPHQDQMPPETSTMSSPSFSGEPLGGPAIISPSPMPIETHPIETISPSEIAPAPIQEPPPPTTSETGSGSSESSPPAQ